MPKIYEHGIAFFRSTRFPRAFEVRVQGESLGIVQKRKDDDMFEFWKVVALNDELASFYPELSEIDFPDRMSAAKGLSAAYLENAEWGILQGVFNWYSGRLEEIHRAHNRFVESLERSGIAEDADVQRRLIDLEEAKKFADATMKAINPDRAERFFRTGSSRGGNRNSTKTMKKKFV